jgi:hypothetical protein
MVRHCVAQQPLPGDSFVQRFEPRYDGTSEPLAVNVGLLISFFSPVEERSTNSHQTSHSTSRVFVDRLARMAEALKNKTPPSNSTPSTSFCSNDLIKTLESRSPLLDF